jgi:hypothetical protein
MSNPAMTMAEVFLTMVTDRSIVVSYDPIPASALHVCPEAARDAPLWDWPMLADTSFRDVAVFEPDLIGNVAV